MRDTPNRRKAVLYYSLITVLLIVIKQSQFHPIVFNLYITFWIFEKIELSTPLIIILKNGELYEFNELIC